MTQVYATTTIEALTQTPITGCETLTDLTDPAQALAEFYRAFNSRDLALIANNWALSAMISMDNPLGGIKRGWPEIRAVYEQIFAGPGRVEVAFFDYTLHQADELFYAVGRERGRLEANGRALDLAIRTSRIFHMNEGRWRQVHHRGSIEEASLLAAYQTAVRATGDGVAR